MMKDSMLPLNNLTLNTECGLGRRVPVGCLCGLERGLERRLLGGLGMMNIDQAFNK